jgi:hypothetical protein
METVRQQDYIISYDYAHPISNGRINEVFEWFYRSFLLENQDYHYSLINLSANIIGMNDERETSVDVEHYIETSKTIWSKLKTFYSEHNFYINTSNYDVKENNLIAIYEQHKSKDINDTVSILKDKQKNLIAFFENIVQLYTAVITKAKIYNRLFHIKICRNKTVRKLRHILVQKQIVLDSFDIAIENIREKNHRRAVIMQCMQQNFGYSNLSPIENALIYTIESYIH